MTSYDEPDVGQGSIVNEILFEYNDFGQLITEYQSHGGTVNTQATPKVRYAYADGSAGTIRPTGITYPNGRVITYQYGTSGGTADAASRVEAIKDGGTTLACYTYLGAPLPSPSGRGAGGEGLPVEVDYPQPQIRYTLVGTAGGNDPDTGDIYRGLDRFGRVKDSYWYDYGSSADADRIKYGYDRAGNRIWRENTVAAAGGAYFDELYDYDGLHRLKTMQRGRLNAMKDGLTTLSFAQDWSLDATGNWSGFKEDEDGDQTRELEQSRTANEVNEITDITETAGPAWATPAYDRAGNMTAIPQPGDPTKTYTATYDAWNRLVKIVDGSTSNTVAEGRNRSSSE